MKPKSHQDFQLAQDWATSERGSLETEYFEVLTSEEAASYLRVSVGSLRNMTSNGHVPYCKLGGRNRYLKKDLQQLLLSKRRGGMHGY